MNKIYVTIPAHCKQGGCESLHQLSDGLTKAGYNCQTIYVEDGSSKIIEDGKPDKFKHYLTNNATSIDDSSDNIIVVPEVWSQALYKFSNIKKCIWWTSVDNNINSERGRFTDWKNLDILHLFESEYAEKYVNMNGASGYMLRDYINSKNYTNLQLDRKNNILFNPVKVTQQTHNAIFCLQSKGYNVIPLQGFSADGLIKIFNESKIYFDFGNFPGYDRLPREAALNGCVVITNRAGSANFYNDMPIDEQYKQTVFDVNVFDSVLTNFEQHTNSQQAYRETLKDDEKNFIPSLKEIWKQ